MNRPTDHNETSVTRPNKYGLQAKSLLAPTVLIVLMAAAFVTVFLSSERQSATLTRTFETAMVKNTTVGTVRSLTVNIHSEMYRIMSLLGAGIDAGQLGSIGKQVSERLARTRRILERLNKDIHLSPIESAHINRVLDALQTYDRSAKDAINAASSGRSIATIYMVGVEQNFDKLQGTLAKLDELVSVVQYGNILDDTRWIQTFVILLLAVAAILGVVLTIISMRQVIRPIVNITGAMRLLASGQTDFQIKSLDRYDEIGDMARALAVFKANAIELKEANQVLQEELLARKAAEVAMKKAMAETEKRIVERDHAEQNLKLLNEELEQRVHERTEKIHRQQDELIQLKKMESLGSLTAGIAHNLNNFLQPIGMYGAILLARDSVDDDEREALESIVASSNRARDLVKHLMAYSRQEGGQKSVQSIYSVITQSSLLLLPTLPATVNLHWNLAENTGDVVMNKGQIQSAVLNLVSNAVDALGGNSGDVTITLARKNTEGDSKGGAKPFACLTVADTGCGMDAETVDQMFDPFYTTKEVGKGTGLGLSTVLGTVTDHGGTISCSSSLGKGTTFEVLLPLAIEE